jgi:hypothetical protein
MRKIKIFILQRQIKKLNKEYFDLSYKCFEYGLKGIKIDYLPILDYLHSAIKKKQNRIDELKNNKPTS